MAMIVKNLDEIHWIAQSSQICSRALAMVASELREGISLLQINTMLHSFILDNGGIPSFLNYNGFPFASCISVNDAIVHGAPTTYIIKDGDTITVDIGVLKEGYHGDQAYTFCVGACSAEAIHLVNVTKMSLYQGLAQAKVGNRIGDIGHAIEKYVQQHHLKVVKDFSGHAIGKTLHEEPFIPNYGAQGRGKLLKENTTFAIEPIISSTEEYYLDDDDLTYRTIDKSLAAHFEHTIVIKKNGPEILTDFSIIEQAEKNNTNLTPTNS